MFKNLSAEEALDMTGLAWLDVRSPAEYTEGTIPGAICLPLLDDDERAAIGKEYHRVGPYAAKKKALEVVSPRIGDMIRQTEQAAGQGRRVVVFCWRGGMRSEYVAYVLDALDFDVFRITGGYKAYRKHVREYLEKKLLHTAVVVHGLTGVGKTRILKHLEKRGLPVIDLEELAVHRGSVYGKVGLPPSPTQKQFESLVFSKLREFEKQGIFLVECESRRLGKLLVPDQVIKTMEDGRRILLYAPLEVRVRRSLEEYVPGGEENMQQLLAATGYLKKFLGQKKVDALNEMIVSNSLEEAVRFLLQEYYDPLYRYPDHADSDYDISVDTTDEALAVEQIERYMAGITRHPGGNGGVPDANRTDPEVCKGSQRVFTG